MTGNSRTKLDGPLLAKIARARKKPEQYIREQISKKAARLGVTSEAAQIIMARELGIGTNRVLRGLPPHLQSQVREAGVVANTPGQRGSRTGAPTTRGRTAEPELAAVELLTDAELKSRCRDLLRARRHFDRVFREATTVLDDRIRTRSGIRRMNPVALVGKALNPDPRKSVLVVSEEPAEQEGMHSICKGLMLAFRDRAHHELNDKLTRNDAIKFCGFVDTILAVVDGARLRERVEGSAGGGTA